MPVENMAFLWNRQKREQIPTSGLDEKDNVNAGIVYSVTFLGSMLVPTPTGHGSSRTATAVDKVYLEKYKVFGYGSKKVGLEVSVDEVRVIGKDGGSEALITFQMSAITYFNLDLKHDKAFVFIVGDEKNKTYRAYVFHCENCIRARELSVKFKEAVKMQEIKSEEMRLRSLSLPSNTPRGGTPSHLSSERGADDWGVFQREGETSWRPRSKTEHTHVDKTTWFEKQRHEGGTISVIPTEGPGVAHDGSPEEAEDEFTMLAEKRLRSFDDKAIPGTFEDKLLLDQQAGIEPQKDNLFHFGASSSGVHDVRKANGAKSFESKNLLDL